MSCKKKLFLLLKHRMYNKSSDVISSADVCIYLEIRTLKWSLSTACYQIIRISENIMETTIRCCKLSNNSNMSETTTNI